MLAIHETNVVRDDKSDERVTECLFGTYVSTIGLHMDHVWIPNWIFYSPLYESHEPIYIWILILILRGCMYKSYMDPKWMLYGSVYEVPQASNSHQL